MELFKLASYFRHFNLSSNAFISARGLHERTIRDFIICEKKLTVANFSERQQSLLAHLESLDPARILYPGHVDYPFEFANIDDPPVFLTFEGDINILKKQKIAVVGSRKPEERFLVWLDTELRSFLQRTGAVVVSGGAIGIDQKASQVSLRASSETVIILPSGLNQSYPRALKASLPHDGVLYLSEYFPDEMVHKSHFVRRNRLISALGRFIFAVQFESRSGTMLTVNCGLAQNKEIGTLPDHPLAALSSGNLKIIREGAHIIGSSQDLIDIWQSMRQLALPIV